MKTTGVVSLVSAGTILWAVLWIGPACVAQQPLSFGPVLVPSDGAASAEPAAPGPVAPEPVVTKPVVTKPAFRPKDRVAPPPAATTHHPPPLDGKLPSPWKRPTVQRDRSVTHTDDSGSESAQPGAPNIQIDVPDGPSKKPAPGARFGKSRWGSDHSSNQPSGLAVGPSARGKGWSGQSAARRPSGETEGAASRERSRRTRADVRERTADLTPQGRTNVR